MNKPVENTMGARIREFRKHCEMKGYEFAKELEISQGSLSDIENGNSRPSAETLRKLATVTHINVHWVLTGKGKMTR